MPDPERSHARRPVRRAATTSRWTSQPYVFGAAKKALQDGLTDAYKGKLFLTNLGWAWAGLC